MKIHFRYFASHFALFRYTLAGKRNSSQDSRMGERRPSNNLQSGVILKVPSAGPSAKPEDSNTYRDSCQQQRKNGSIYGSSQRGEYNKLIKRLFIKI